jgi:hypothetical protein
VNGIFVLLETLRRALVSGICARLLLVLLLGVVRIQVPKDLDHTVHARCLLVPLRVKPTDDPSDAQSGVHGALHVACLHTPVE